MPTWKCGRATKTRAPCRRPVPTSGVACYQHATAVPPTALVQAGASSNVEAKLTGAAASRINENELTKVEDLLQRPGVTISRQKHGAVASFPMTDGWTARVVLKIPGQEWPKLPTEYEVEADSRINVLVRSAHRDGTALGFDDDYGSEAWGERNDDHHHVGLIYVTHASRVCRVIGISTWMALNDMTSPAWKLVSLAYAGSSQTTNSLYRKYKGDLPTACQLMCTWGLYWFRKKKLLHAFRVVNVAEGPGCACYVGAAERNGLKVYYQSGENDASLPIRDVVRSEVFPFAPLSYAECRRTYTTLPNYQREDMPSFIWAFLPVSLQRLETERAAVGTPWVSSK